MTRIVVGCTCDLSQAVVEEYGMEILPLHVLVEDEAYLDGVTITTHEVYDRMRQGVMPKTAQVSVAGSSSRKSARFSVFIWASAVWGCSFSMRCTRVKSPFRVFRTV